jgi:hypothetical protein
MATREAYKIRSALGNVSVARMQIRALRAGMFNDPPELVWEEIMERFAKVEEILQQEAVQVESTGIPTIRITNRA